MLVVRLAAVFGSGKTADGKAMHQYTIFCTNQLVSNLTGLVTSPIFEAKSRAVQSLFRAMSKSSEHQSRLAASCSRHAQLTGSELQCAI